MITLSESQFDRFQTLIYQHSGIRLDNRKMTLLTSRLNRRLRSLKMESVDDYYALVTRRGETTELQALLDVITTNETSFYRTQPHFDWFSNDFLARCVADVKSGQRERRLRLWSAACSIGAEPYTMAFCLYDQRHRLSNWNVDLLASDLCVTSLETARQGIYAQRLVDSLDEKVIKRFFRRLDTTPPTYQVRDAFRSQVDFFHQNLMKPLRREKINAGPFDCIFLRNILIYFDESSKQSVLNHVVSALAKGGYLVIGPSEGIFGLENPLEKLSTFLYRKSS